MNEIGTSGSPTNASTSHAERSTFALLTGRLTFLITSVMRRIRAQFHWRYHGYLVAFLIVSVACSIFALSCEDKYHFAYHIAIELAVAFFMLIPTVTSVERVLEYRRELERREQFEVVREDSKKRLVSIAFDIIDAVWELFPSVIDQAQFALSTAGTRFGTISLPPSTADQALLAKIAMKACFKLLSRLGNEKNAVGEKADSNSPDHELLARIARWKERVKPSLVLIRTEVELRLLEISKNKQLLYWVHQLASSSHELDVGLIDARLSLEMAYRITYECIALVKYLVENIVED